MNAKPFLAQKEVVTQFKVIVCYNPDSGLKDSESK